MADGMLAREAPERKEAWAFRELREHAGEPTADKAAGYFENNRSRMRYPRYRAMGLPIGSGIVESSCGTLVGARFKRGGRRWSKAGANDIPAPMRLRPQRTVRQLLAPAARAADLPSRGAAALKRRTPCGAGV